MRVKAILIVSIALVVFAFGLVSSTSRLHSSSNGPLPRRTGHGDLPSRRPGAVGSSRHEVSLKPLAFFDILHEITKPLSLGWFV